MLFISKCSKTFVSIIVIIIIIIWLLQLPEKYRIPDSGTVVSPSSPARTRLCLVWPVNTTPCSKKFPAESVSERIFKIA